MKYKKLITLILIVILSLSNITLSSLAYTEEDSTLETGQLPEQADISSATLTVYPNPLGGKYHYIQDVITGTGTYFSSKNSFLCCSDGYGNTMMCYCTEPTRPAPTTSTEYSDYYLEDINSEAGIKQAKTLPILTYGFGANEASCNSFLNNYPENPQQGGSFGYYAVDGVITRGLLINGVLFPMSSSEAYGLTAALVHKANGADVGTITGCVAENGFSSGTQVAAAATYLETISTWTYEKGVAGGSLWHAADALNSLKRGEHIFTAQIEHPNQGWIPLPDTSAIKDWSPYSIGGKINIKITYESTYMENQLLPSSQSGSEGYINFNHESITTVDFDSSKNGYYDYFKVISNPENQVNVSVLYSSLKNNSFIPADIPCSTYSGTSFYQDAYITLNLNELNEGKYLSLSIASGNGACRTDAYGDGDQDGTYSLGVRYFQTPSYQNVAVSSPNPTIPYTSTYLYMSNELGKFTLEKQSSNISITENNSNYSLEGAIYSIYKSEADAKSNKNICGTITTNQYGKGSSPDLNVGSYYIKETKASPGYSLDNTIYSVSINSSQDVHVSLTEIPQINTIDILLLKTDNNSIPLANAQFTIKYYSEITNDPQKDKLTPTRSWTVKTDKNGIAKLTPEYLISGDELYYSSNNKPGIPLGTITIEETMAPNGYYEEDEFKEWEYIMSNDIYIQTISSSGSTETINCFSVPTITNEKKPFKSYLKIIKKDDSTGKSILNNPATFKIWSYAEEKYILEGTTDSNGILMTTECLLEGKYRIEEIENPDCYYTSTVTSYYDFEINEDTITEKYITPEGEETIIGICTIEIENTPLTGQILINKYGENYTWDEDTDSFVSRTEPLENIEFNIYSYEDIYSSDGHNILLYPADTLIETIVTNADGCAKTTDTLPLGTYIIKENVPDIYLPQDDIIVELSPQDEMSEVVTENTIKKTVVYNVDVTNKLKIPAISTYAINKETEKKYLPTNQMATITDLVTYENLIPGQEYKITGTLMSKSTREALIIDSNPVTATTTFIPDTSSGNITVTFKFNPANIGNSDVVVFEELFYNNELIACHKDYNSYEQTVHFVTPVIDSEIAEEPTTEETTTEEPVIEEPVPEKPTTEEPTTDEPTTEEPTTEEPTTEPITPDSPSLPEAPATGDSSSLGYIIILLILSGILISIFFYKSTLNSKKQNK